MALNKESELRDDADCRVIAPYVRSMSFLKAYKRKEDQTGGYDIQRRIKLWLYLEAPGQQVYHITLETGTVQKGNQITIEINYVPF